MIFYFAFHLYFNFSVRAYLPRISLIACAASVRSKFVGTLDYRFGKGTHEKKVKKMRKEKEIKVRKEEEKKRIPAHYTPVYCTTVYITPPYHTSLHPTTHHSTLPHITPTPHSTLPHTSTRCC